MMTTANMSKNSTYTIGAWVVLMVLTAASWWLGADHDLGGLGVKASMVAIMFVTFGKIAVVGHAFMELREAARWLQLSFFGWCAAMCVCLSVFCVLV